MVPTSNGNDGGEVWRKGSWDERELLADEFAEGHDGVAAFGEPTAGGFDGDLKYVEIDPINQKVVRRFGNTMGASGIGLNSSRMS